MKEAQKLGPWKLVAVFGSVLVAGIAGGLIAWGGQRAEVSSLKERQIRLEITQLEDGRSISGHRARLDAFDKWLERIENKLDTALQK